MRPTAAALLVMCLPLVAAAQEPTESTTAASDGPALRLPTIDFATVANLGPLAPRTSAQPQPRRAPQPRPADAGSRRRPSMVGYIEDAGIHSQIRLRFDAGFGNTAPDRAEFFYAKCGCFKTWPVPYTDPEGPGPGGAIPADLNFQQSCSVWRDCGAGSVLALRGTARARDPARGVHHQPSSVAGSRRSVRSALRRQGRVVRRRLSHGDVPAPRLRSDRRRQQRNGHAQFFARAGVAVPPGHHGAIRPRSANRRLASLWRIAWADSRQFRLFRRRVLLRHRTKLRSGPNRARAVYARRRARWVARPRRIPNRLSRCCVLRRSPRHQRRQYESRCAHDGGQPPLESMSAWAGGSPTKSGTTNCSDSNIASAFKDGLIPSTINARVVASFRFREA